MIYRTLKGFTLSEVLITLGIIGVVAAITMPTFIKNYQKMVWINQLKKSYSTMQQGFKMMLANEGVELLSQTEVFNSIGGAEQTGGNGVKYKICEIGSNGITPSCNDFIIKISKYFNISTKPISYSGKYLNGASFAESKAYPFIDKSTFSGFFYSCDPNKSDNLLMKGMVATITIDINGKQGPNILGRDIFNFFVADNGTVYPRGTKEQSLSEFNNETDGYWNGTGVWRNCKADGKSYGVGCAARIIESGWKMNY